MKKIILISIIFLAGLTTTAQTKTDTTKKYILTLTEGEYQALQQKLSEAAIYEAQLQKDKTDAAYQEFLKKNTKEIPKKESK
jgi:hypothetical protein